VHSQSATLELAQARGIEPEALHHLQPVHGLTGTFVEMCTQNYLRAPCTDHTLLDRVAWRGVRHCRMNILSPGTCGDAGSQNPTGPNATCYTCWKADGQGKCTVPIEGCQVVEECGWPLMMSEVWGRYPCESNPHPLIRHEVHRFKRTHSALPTTGSASVRCLLPTLLEYLHLARGFEISSAFACLCLLLLAFEGMCL